MNCSSTFYSLYIFYKSRRQPEPELHRTTSQLYQCDVASYGSGKITYTVYNILHFVDVLWERKHQL
jgi:hypothetical protein